MYHAREGPLDIVEVEVAHEREVRRATFNMDLFTPRPRIAGRKNNLSLSTKEYAKVRRKSLQNIINIVLISPGHRYHRLRPEEQTSISRR
jgi:hypothetical protein